ncbi:MAG TPA: hypothetical protein VFB08_08670 [Burkholderiales bacterium]|nr:hypothetical protein [Burkholderiales bacterium]
MLALKLALVPFFLALLSLAARRWGPGVAGWLAGLPLVTGPVLVFVALERGDAFAAGAARASLAGVFAMVAFQLGFAWAAMRFGWPGALGCALACWLAAALGLGLLPDSTLLSLALALGALVAAPALFPPAQGDLMPRSLPRHELALRMAAGALFVVAVTASAPALGPAWTGRVSTLPILGLVLAVFSHRASGSAFVVALLRAMASGLYSYVAFCVALALLLARQPLAMAFLVAILAGLAAQAATRLRARQGSSAARR